MVEGGFIAVVLESSVIWLFYYMGVWGEVRRDLELSLALSGGLGLSKGLWDDVATGNLWGSLSGPAFLVYDTSGLSRYSVESFYICVSSYSVGAIGDVAYEEFSRFLDAGNLSVYREGGSEWEHTDCIYMGLVPFMAMARAGGFGIVGFDLVLLDGDYWDEGFVSVKNYWLSGGIGERILVCACGNRALDLLGVDEGLQGGYKAWFSEVGADVYGFLFDFVSSVI